MTRTEPGSATALHARHDIGRLAEHLASGLDHDRARVDPDAGEKFGLPRSGVARVELTERAVNGERRAHRAFGVVLLRLRVAEERHQAVPEVLQHVAAEVCHC